MRIEVIGVTGLPIIGEGDDLASLIIGAAEDQDTPLMDGDIVVLSHVIVSRAEGRTVNLGEVEPSKVAERFAEAVDAAQRSLQRKPDEHNTHALLAISYAHLGRIDEARSAFREVLRLQPDYSLAGVRQIFAAADDDFVELVIDGLRKAGLEE